MHQLSNFRLLRSARAILVSAALLVPATAAHADAGFQKWIANFYATAAKGGISKSTYQQAFKGVKTPDPDVLEKAAYQPEFKHKIWDYLDSRVNPYTVKIGQEMAAKYGRTLAAVEKRYGVDRNILLFFFATLAVASVVVFAVLELLPGNAAEVILGDTATPESIAALQARLGLD